MVPRNLASYVADDVRRLHLDPSSPDRNGGPKTQHVPRHLASYVADDVRRLHRDPLSP